jgi:hypothetical protein
MTAVAAVATGCTRPNTPSTTATSAPPVRHAPATDQTTGTFGSEQQVCAPGPGAGGSGRGISGKTIRVGVMGDPGSAAAPGLGQEFFDAADAFATWCNAAGGINGRTIVIDKHDAKLFNTGTQMIAACQRDFMLVGGGNALDAPGVKPRLACGLGQIPAYTVSPEATTADLQVTPNGSTPQKYPIGTLKLLADAYPASQQGFGIAGSSLASVAPQGLRAAEAWRKLGYKVSALQPRPALVDNYRSWMEQFKLAGAKADFEVAATNATPILTAIQDVGWKPAFLFFGQPIYGQPAVQAARSVQSFPPSFVQLSFIPWELAGRYPVVSQAKSIMMANGASPNFDAFTAYALDTWVLWAQSATACGANLTRDCVLQHAGAHPAWTAGGFFAPVNTEPRLHDYPSCLLFAKLTTSGWTYDAGVTKPNSGAFNCDSSNLTAVRSYESGG